MATSRSFALAKLLRGGTKIDTASTNATNLNTASTLVSRDASGNFSAGTISAALSGNATTATTLQNARTIAISGDVTGSATSFNGGANITISAGITAGSIVDADVNASAAIADTKLATIATAGKVSNSATTATNANTANAIVARDASGNFSAGTITAALTGAASSNVLKAGDTMTGQLISTLANSTTAGGGQLYLNGATGNRIDFNTNGVAGPSYTTRSAGTKLLLYPALSGVQVDYAMGISPATMWSSVPVNESSFSFKWYGGDIEVASLTGAGTLTAVAFSGPLTGNATSATTATTLSGLTSSITELNYTDGVTSSIQTQLDTKAPLSSPALTGSPTAPTATVGTNDTKIATTAFVVAEIDNRGFDSADAIFLIDSSYVVTRITNLADTKLATISTAGKVSNSATTATSANTASAIVSRDASGNFTAGTITADLSGTVTTAAQPNITSVGTLTSLTSSGIVSGSELTSTQSSGDEGGQVNLGKPATNSTIAGNGVVIDVYQNRIRFFEQGSPNRGAYIDITACGSSLGTNLLGSSTPGDGTLTLAVSGTGLSGSASFTANQSTGSTFTVTSNATNANTPSTIVARDASGNFTAGTITAALSGNATSATTLQNARTIAISGDVTGSATSFNGSANITISASITAGSIVSADFSSATSLIIYNSAGTAVKTVYSPGS